MVKPAICNLFQLHRTFLVLNLQVSWNPNYKKFVSTELALVFLRQILVYGFGGCQAGVSQKKFGVCRYQFKYTLLVFI